MTTHKKPSKAAKPKRAKASKRLRPGELDGPRPHLHTPPRRGTPADGERHRQGHQALLRRSRQLPRAPGERGEGA